MCIISIITCKSHINVGFIYCERVGLALCILEPKINIKKEKKKKTKFLAILTKKRCLHFFFFFGFLYFVDLLKEKERG